jgi:hypothetical protein
MNGNENKEAASQPSVKSQPQAVKPVALDAKPQSDKKNLVKVEAPKAMTLIEANEAAKDKTVITATKSKPSSSKS